ncbi:MAG: efflux RND transporter periplasmic adaptor subunit [Parvibaculaceae bacterium]|nr:efflux RND transporter periplasmic adaptor subunit [Parvibaculaceae bacterium]
MPRLLQGCLIVSLTCLVLGLGACGKKEEQDPRTQVSLVRSVLVQPASGARSRFTGVILARVQSNLGFRVAGKVTERLVDTGQNVRKGQVLMRIDAVDLELAVRAQTSAVEAARAHFEQTNLDEIRLRRLLPTRAISVQVYERAKADADSARASLQAAQAQARVAENAGSYAELLADSDGIVVNTLAEPGQVVAAGQTVVQLAHAGPREARVDLPENIRPALGSTAQARLYGGAGPAYPAWLRELSLSADPVTRTFEARYVLEDTGTVPLGTTVTIDIAGKNGTDGYVVPIGALYDGGKGPGVWVIEGEGDATTVSLKPVSISRLGEEEAILSGGVARGERVVAVGAHLLHEGEKVRLEMVTGAAQ